MSARTLDPTTLRLWIAQEDEAGTEPEEGNDD